MSVSIIGHLCARSGGALRGAGLGLAVALSLYAPAFAQNINVAVTPGGTIDIQNNSGNRWYFLSGPTNGSGATMSRVSSDLVAVYPWPTVGSFAPDTVSYVQNRLFQGEYLRVYAGSLPAGAVIRIPYNTPNPLNTTYSINVSVLNAASVSSISLLDPSPTAAATVRWAVTFSEPIANVTAANFTLLQGGSITGAYVTSVTGTGANWTVTANSGTGFGLLYCNWAGHSLEVPPVPVPFTGSAYDFAQLPLVTLDPADGAIVSGQTHTMTVAGSIRGGGGVTYQWYSGSSQTPLSATLIPGATSPTYQTPAIASGQRQYFCRVFNALNTAYNRDSLTATVTVYTPVQITGQPSAGPIASGSSTTLTVTATGDARHYQWYQGSAGTTNTPVGTDSPSYSTPTLNANRSYWVRVYNPLPPAYDQNSAGVTVRVVTSLTPNGPSATLINEPFLTAPGVTVRDSDAAIIANFPVVFSVAGNPNPASCAFGGQPTVTAYSDAAGFASVAATANGSAGTYTATASVGAVSAGISLRNVAALAVNTTVDENNGTIDPASGTGLSLRECVSYAEAQPGAQTITFAPAIAGQAVVLSAFWPSSADTALYFNSPLVIDGGAGTTLRLASGVTGRHAIAWGSAALTLRNLTFTGGNLDGVNEGGAFYNLGTTDVQNVRFTTNRARSGGAIWNSGILRITNSVLDHNTAAAGNLGGAIGNSGTLQIQGSVFSANEAYLGGAINSDNALSIVGSTFSNNIAGFNGGALRIFGAAGVTGSTFNANQAGNGGGAIMSHGALRIVNATVAGNAAPDGAGIQAFEGTIEATHVTIVSNATTSGTAGLVMNYSTGTLVNVIVAGNTINGAPGDLWGTPLAAASHHNLIGTSYVAGLTNGVNGNLVGVSASVLNLGPLAANGGPTRTIAPASGSPVINAGAAVAGLPVDQRGEARSVGGAPDIGAFEDASGDDDPDRDTVGNAREVLLGSSPFASDTDSDGFNDATEQLAGSNPALASSVPPTNHVECVLGYGPGRGLDLSGTFRYALNIGTVGAAGTAGDATFTSDSVSGAVVSAVNAIPAWIAPDLGNTAADTALETVFQSIRWTPHPGALTVDLQNLIPSRRYKLQLLFGESDYAARVFDVRVGNTLAVDDFRPYVAQGSRAPNYACSAIVHEFVATNTTLHIELDGTTTPGGVGVDQNPILNGVTLEEYPPSLPTQAIAIASASLPAGSFALSFSNLASASFTVYGSTNVLAPPNLWSNLGTATESPPGSGRYQISIPVVSNRPAFFYRIQSP